MCAFATYKKIICRKLSVNLREATEVIEVPFPKELRPSEVLVKNKFVGINASDINFTAGIYQPDVKVPFDCGFEALGEVVSVGAKVKLFKPGDAVVTQFYGSFAEYQAVPQRHAYKVPSLNMNWLPLPLSGVTASIAINEVLKPVKGERAVVTAAAGGTGQFAAQILQKVHQCSVVGTCSSTIKAKFIKETLGCDHFIVTSSNSNLSTQLSSVFPTGVNIAYESVGGPVLDDVVDNLALKGRILSIGSISCYQNNSIEVASRKPLPLRLLSKSASLNTFFLSHYIKYIPKHLDFLIKLVDEGTIVSCVDRTLFKGLASVPDAVDFMYSRKNCGKIVVQLC